MSTKEIYLKELIYNSNLEPQIKINKIINTLQKTEDILKAKILSKQILEGNFTGLKDKSIDNLTETFKSYSQDANAESAKFENNNESNIANKPETNKPGANNSAPDEFEALKQEMLAMRNNYEREISKLNNELNKVAKENDRLKELTKLTLISELIEVSDDDIDELYLKYRKNGTTKHNNAIVVDGIIPKSYYKI